MTILEKLNSFKGKHLCVEVGGYLPSTLVKWYPDDDTILTVDYFPSASAQGTFKFVLKYENLNTCEFVTPSRLMFQDGLGNDYPINFYVLQAASTPTATDARPEATAKKLPDSEYIEADISDELRRTILTHDMKLVIEKPKTLIIRKGGSTHRVVTEGGEVYCYAAPETGKSIISWTPKNIREPVQF